MEKEFNNNESEQQVPRNLSEQLCEMYEQMPKREKKSWKSWKDFNAECRLDMTAPDKPDNSRFNVGGVKIAHEGSIVSVGATQYYVMTEFLVALASVMIGGRPFGNIKRETPPKKILWVDNCRDEEDIVEIIWKVYQLAGIPEDTPFEKVGLHVLSLQRPFIDERGSIIQKAIDDLNPDVLIIDDVEALLYDYMSVKESYCVVDWLNRNKHNRTIFATMRTNERNNRKGGHLGTELGIKSYDELTIIEKDGRYEVVHESNGRPIGEKIAFKIDEDGLPVPVDVK